MSHRDAESHGHSDRPKIEEDVFLSRVLGAVLFIVIPVFGFYVGTVGGKSWFFDYQPKDMAAGFKGFAVGILVAAIINLFIWVGYQKTIARDVENEWYGPQSGHH